MEEEEMMQNILSSEMEEAKIRLMEKCMKENDVMGWFLLDEYDCWEEMGNGNGVGMMIAEEMGINRVAELRVMASQCIDMFSPEGLDAYFTVVKIDEILEDGEMERKGDGKNGCGTACGA